MDIFIDEAGYTGPDLVNKDQPAFVLESTVLTELDARTLLDECFGADREREVKHSRLSKTKRGRTQLLDFFQRVDRRKIGFFGVHKEYVLLAYLIDFWLEPLAHRDGVNLYERGANIALTNVSYVTLGATLGIEGRRELLRRFQVMQRDRTTFAYASFWELVFDAVRKHRLIEEAYDPREDVTKRLVVLSQMEQLFSVSGHFRRHSPRSTRRRSLTSISISTGAVVANSTRRAFQSRFLTWSARTTPVTLASSGRATSNG